MNNVIDRARVAYFELQEKVRDMNLSGFCGPQKELDKVPKYLDIKVLEYGTDQEMFDGMYGDVIGVTIWKDNLGFYSIGGTVEVYDENGYVRDLTPEEMSFIKQDGDTFCLDGGSGDKVFRIPVEWKVFDTVKVRADSLEEAVRIFLKNTAKIPLGKNPEYADDSYQISTYETHNVPVIAKELREDWDEQYLSEDWDYDER